jgi:arylsulfatase A
MNDPCRIHWPLRLFVGLCLLLVGDGFAIAAEKPNIVILLCDDLGYGDLSCFAHPQMRTPHLDKLALEGVKLTHCYASAPVCSPSRAGLLTGRVPNRLGIRDWIPADSGIYLRPGEVTIAQLLKEAGYHTCHAGKWHLNSKTDGSERTPGEAGFDHWLYTQNNASPSHLNPTNFVRNGKPAGKLEGSSSHIVVAEAIRFLEAKPGKPFFLNLWFHEPHEPVAAAEEFLNLYPKEDNLDRRHYYGDVSQMDAAVGKLLKYLDDHKLRENTFIFFSSDNGPETLNRYKGANRSYGSPGPLRGMKLHITEAGYRVPGIVRWPGHTRAGTVSTEPVCHVDLLPTLCAIAGVPPSPTLSPKPGGEGRVRGEPERKLDGADITPLFAAKPVQRPHPLYWQYDFAISRPWVVSLRDGPWKLLADAELAKFELYNLVDDVGESKNVAEQNPERVKRMAADMKRLHEEIRAEGAKSGNPPPRQPKK